MHYSTKTIELGSCAFRQPQATSHCRFIHGYQLKAKFWFAAKTLDENNWVVDFGNFKEFKVFLKKQFDHTTCISKFDPHADKFLELEKAGVCDLRIMDGVGIEKFAEYCHDVADNYVGVITKLRCRCVKVEVFEHQDNSAIYQKFPDDWEASHSYISSDSYISTQEHEHQDIESKIMTGLGEVLDSRYDETPPETSAPEVETLNSSEHTNNDGESDNPEQKTTNSEVGEKQQEPDIKKPYNQQRTVGKWVDPKYSGKTTNTWLF